MPATPVSKCLRTAKTFAMATLAVLGLSGAAQAANLTIFVDGLGTVTSSPAGIDCGKSCVGSFAAGTTVTLTGTPGSGGIFSGFSGEGCSGTTCTVTLTTNTSVTARFTTPSLTTYLLSVEKTGAGTGVVTSSPEGVSCGNVCFRNSAYLGPTVPAPLVTLTAVADANSVFTGWSGGGCSGTSTCTVTMASSATVTANFGLSTQAGRLTNVATRGFVGTGDNVMIGGFVIQGNSPVKVVVTARGPSLAALGVPGVLANPTLTLYSGQTVIGSNDDWGTAPNLAEIQASGFAPANPLESAILMTLNPGGYTAIVSGTGGATGIAIVEAFEVYTPQ